MTITEHITTGHIVVYCSCPNQEVASQLAETLVTRQLAACVNIIPGVQSVYQWQGKLQQDAEVLMMIKTRSDCFEALQALVIEQHPYELPEIIAVPLTQGLPAYLGWIDSSTGNQE